MSKNTGLILKVSDEVTENMEKLRKELGLKNTADVFKLGMNLLEYAMGRKVEMSDINSNKSLVFDQFAKKKPFK